MWYTNTTLLNVANKYNIVNASNIHQMYCSPHNRIKFTQKSIARFTKRINQINTKINLSFTQKSIKITQK